MKPARPTSLVLSLLLLQLFPLLLLADDPICGKWRFFNGSERMMNADGTSNGVGMKPDSRWLCITPMARAGEERRYAIRDSKGSEIDRLTLSRDAAELWGWDGKKPFLSAKRIAGAMPVSAKPAPPSPAVRPAPLAPSSAPSGNALESIITQHEWLWSEPGSASGRGGKLRFIPGGKVQHPWPNLPEWQWQRLGETIAIGPTSLPAEQRLVLSFNVERSEFRGTLPSGQQVLGLRSDLISGPKTTPGTMPGQSATPPQPAAGTGPLTTGYGGMTLGKDWLPRSTQVKRNELTDLAFYSSYAVGGMTAGKEPIPQFIVPPLRWLMPLDEASKALGDGVSPVPMKAFQNDCWPQNSLIIRCFQKRYFSDLDGEFNLIYLIADAQQRLVSVQYKSQAKVMPVLRPGTIEALRAMHPPWGPPIEPPPHDGVRDHSYYDFINEGRSSNGLVSYQLRRSADNSVLLIRLDQKVQWYVPAPFARCLLDISEHYQKQGLIK